MLLWHRLVRSGVPVQASDIAWVGHVFRETNLNLVLFWPKFNNLETKNTILPPFRKLKGVKMQELGFSDNQRTVYFDSNLTTHNRDLHHEARKLKPLWSEFVWTFNCRIYVRETKEDKPMAVI